MFRSARNGINTGRYVRAVQKGRLREDTILLESKRGKDLAGNVFRILQELCKDEYKNFKIYLAVSKSCEDRIKKMTDTYGMVRYRFVRYGSVAYYRLLGTAKYLVEDTTFPHNFIKRKDQVYLNTWHGTPWKRMGKDEEAGAYAIGNVQKNLLYADYLLYPNPYMKSCMFGAYMLEDLYRHKVLYEGYPRNSVFFDEEQSKRLRKELGIDKNQVIVYMPTWRGAVNKCNASLTEEACACFFDILDELLSDDQIFYVKFHVFASKTFPFEDYKHIRPFPGGYETYEVLNTADVLVTDYSSVFFDFANTGRKIILFPYDYGEYMGVRGLYTTLEEMPFPKVYTARELAEELNRPKEYDDTEFRKQYCTYDSPDAVSRLVRQVFCGENVCKVEDYSKIQEQDTRKKILVFSAGLDQNGITTSLLSIMKEADTKNNSYYFTFFQNSLRKEPLRIRRIPEYVNFFPINGTITDLTLFELIAFKLFYRFKIDTPWVFSLVRRLYAREFQKHFADTPFDGVVHYTGYSKEITTMFSTAPCRTVVFAHNDMMREVESKGNQFLPALRHAYHEYDVVAPVSESVWDSIRAISDPNRVQVIENTHDDAGVKAKAELELTVEDQTIMSVTQEELEEVLADETLVRFINIGRFSPEKGHIKLIDAFVRYHAEHENTRLIIIGGYGAKYNTVLEYAKAAPCADAIIVIRSIMNPFPIMKRCHLFLLASDYEALALVLLEAESLGVPAVATDIPGSGDLMRKHGGYIVENNVEGLYQGMCAYRDGKVKTMGINFENYNRKSAEKFNALFNGEKV